MQLLDEMAVFVRVADLASFTKAADHLDLPKATVTRAVQRLEAAVGTRLLHRTTRRVQLTDDGQALHERCRDLLAEVDDIQSMFAATTTGPRGRLHVDLPLAVARDIVIPQLPTFLQAHPGIRVELSSSDQRVDVVRDGFDCVLRVGPLHDSSLVARPLGHFAFVNCASPAYLQRQGTPASLADLAGHQLVHYTHTPGARAPGFVVQGPGGGRQLLAMPTCLVVNNSDAYVAACLAGLGLIQAPLAIVGPHLERGALLAVLPQHTAAPMPVSLLYAHRRHVPQRTQAFMQWLAAVMEPYLVN
ncbi:LysR family transcriptional regulator [Rubrivivax sp. RP6-9]|uniref:LysR family transcriptional regulator n=1 Tax=Rubrivivax sp. RP6-9 TaxID=3415750 RepID=UPI003CC63747